MGRSEIRQSEKAFWMMIELWSFLKRAKENFRQRKQLVQRPYGGNEDQREECGTGVESKGVSAGVRHSGWRGSILSGRALLGSGKG